MDKVKISKELADAIDGVINHADENILYDVTYIKNVCEGDKFDSPKLMPIYNYIQKVGFKEYFKVLVYGHEVEETLEDKVQTAFDRAPGIFNDTNRQIDYENGMHKILEIYNIKIVGVNHE